MISVIITTYNNPKALAAVLRALAAQKITKWFQTVPYATIQAQKSKNQTPTFELIIADDGSTRPTKMLIDIWRKKALFPIYHVWQPHQGFRAAKIRNLAVAKSHGDYLVFIDGDSVPRRNFIAKHNKLAALHHFVVGNRILLTQEFTAKIFATKLAIHNFSTWRWFKIWLSSFLLDFRKTVLADNSFGSSLKKNVDRNSNNYIQFQTKADLQPITTKKNIGVLNRFAPLLTLPLGALRNIFPRKWCGAKTCNLALWRRDFVAINGFDENFEGWGYEDSDLVIRLIKNGVYRKSGHFALPVLHLWHPFACRVGSEQNYARLQQTLKGK